MTPDLLARLQSARAALQPVALLTRLSDGHQCLWPEDSAPGALAEAAQTALRDDAARTVTLDGEDWFVHPQNPPLRLDKALARDVPVEAALSRTRLARLIEQGQVSRGGVVVTDAKLAVAEGDEIDITVPVATPVETLAEDLPLQIIFEDDDLAVINKPAGLVVHPAPGSATGTMVNALLHHFGEGLSGVGGEKRPGIVHRIDKDTSGLLVVAKSDRAHQGLARHFEAHTAERTYLALCHGVPDHRQ